MTFNTTNTTFRQLMGNGLSYRVPPFQRDYSWGPDEWDDLWNDLAEPAHYLGYLVLQSTDNRTFAIIDGQQRMTTLSLLMLAAVAHLTELAAPDTADDPELRRAAQLRANYLGYLDPVSLVPRSKLTLNRNDDRFYQDYLVPLERLPQRGLNHHLGGAADTIRELRSVYPDDGEFRAAFADKELRTTSSRNRKVARYLLFRLERHVSGEDFDFESAQYDLEHVLPEWPGEAWEQFDDRQRESFTYRLGNLTLLAAADNRAAGNADFAAKRPTYGDSRFAVTRKIAGDYDAWTVDKIASRQRWMARQATSIWRLDF